MDYEPLSEIEIRILGTLMEKQITTPDLYPLSLNSLTNACNQKNSRNPVTSYSDKEIEASLEDLRVRKLVQYKRDLGGRVPKFEQLFSREYGLKPDDHAVMGVLMLRGAQTVGELRTRTEPIYKFESLQQVEEVLERFAGRQLVVKLERQAGERDARWTHLLTGAPTISDDKPSAPRSGGGQDLVSRVEALEAEVLALKRELEQLKGESSNS
jgi:uncharacterized protein YceH (UPF0502 family)